jgi:uncharacterized protein (TIGR02466 family)
MRFGNLTVFQSLFATRLYSGRLSPALTHELEAACLAIAAEDRAGQRWARTHGYEGYTSYASLDDLPLRAPGFAALEEELDKHAAIFSREVQFDLTAGKGGRRRLAVDSMWVNVMTRDASHAAHIHPHAVISGAFYVNAPAGAGAIRFEDPRLPMMMAAPPRKPDARPENRTFVTVAPKAGTLLLWESWLRHGVEANAAKTPRISISFNYRLD